MKNIDPIISSNNEQVLLPHNQHYGCNCRKKERCLLDNKHLTPKIIHEAQITNHTNDEFKKYVDPAETLFEERYSNHTRYF